MLERLKNEKTRFDFIIIGGGATGIGIALEASARGYSVILFEKSDFAKSTSSKSTKLVHGGVRYLAQGDVALVREACIERGLLLRNAPHLVKNQSFIIPAYGWYDEFLYTAGLKVYDLMAGRYSLGRSRRISKKETTRRIPGISEKGLTAGILYHDGQFDDSRMAISVLQTAVEKDAVVLNYMQVISLKKDNTGKLAGVCVKDELTGEELNVEGKIIINATGVFADEVLQMDVPEARKTIRPSQGVHIVLDNSFLEGDDALMIPKTDDGRVLFAVPWHGRVVVGTTDTPVEKASLEPVALEEEISFILSTAGKYLKKPVSKKDVLSVFAGLRPLAAPQGDGKKTKEISRSHKIIVSRSGLMTMVGGKWTTFRKMAEDMINKAEKINGWKKTLTKTRHLKIHGYKENVDLKDPLYVYGSDRDAIMDLAGRQPGLHEVISEELGIIKAQIVWAVKEEMAVNIEDFLSRRTRCQLLNARESLRIAPIVAQIMAAEMVKDNKWIKEQLTLYELVTRNYYF